MTVLQRIEEGQAVDVRPLAKIVGMSAATLYRAVGKGEIEATKIGKRVTVPAHVARRLLCLPEKAA